MVKGTETFKKVIKGYLDHRAANDDLFAARYKKANKSIDECCDYIISQVKKSGCNGFADDEIFSLAIHYYDEDDIKDIPKATAFSVVVNLSDHTKEELEKKAEEENKAKVIANIEAKDKIAKEKAEKKLQAKKQEEKDAGQLSLFDF